MRTRPPSENNLSFCGAHMRNQGNIDELKRRLPRLETTVPNLFSKTASEMAGPCPKCGGEDRFIVNTATQRFWCRPCKWRGDVIDYNCFDEGLDLKGLMQAYGVGGKNGSKPPSRGLKPGPAEGKSTASPARPPATPDYQQQWDAFKEAKPTSQILANMHERKIDVALPYLLKHDLIRFKPEFEYLFPGFDDTGNLVAVQHKSVNKGIEPKFFKGSTGKEAVYPLQGDVDGPTVVTGAPIDSISALLATKFSTLSTFSESYSRETFISKLKHLKDSNVVVFFDNDDKGKAGASKILKAFPGFRLVDWSLAPQGMKDVNDLRKAGHDDIIKKMIDEAKAPERPAEEKQAELRVHTLESIYVRDIEVDPILDGLWNAGDAVIIAANSGVGKSIIAQDIAMHLGAGMPYLWGRFKIPKLRTVLFAQSENSPFPVKERTQKKCAGCPDFLRGLQNVFFAGLDDDIQLVGQINDDDSHLSTKIKMCAEMIKKDTGKPPDIVCFDPLISYHSGDENSNAEMRRTLDRFGLLCRQIGATPLIVHHNNRLGDIRGAAAIRDWTRVLIKLTRIEKTVGDRPQIKFVNDKQSNMAEVRPFVLEMDENLNFTPLELVDTLGDKAAGHCLTVIEVLKSMGGTCLSQKELVAEICNLSRVSPPTARRHIDTAVENGFIQRKEYAHNGLKKIEYTTT